MSVNKSNRQDRKRKTARPFPCPIPPSKSFFLHITFSKHLFPSHILSLSRISTFGQALVFVKRYSILFLKTCRNKGMGVYTGFPRFC